MIRLALLLGAWIVGLLPLFRPPSPPYLGPAFRSSRGSNKPIDRIVIHSTVSPSSAGWARKIAAYFRSSAAGGSAHYVVDSVEVVQVVFDGVIAWHAPPNGNSLGVELCDYPTNEHGKRWEDDEHKRMFWLAVNLVADLCLAYDVPPWFRGPLALRAGRRGITTHNYVSTAFGQSSHWDPGNWPRRKFVRAVRKKVKAAKKAAKKGSK